MLSHRARLIVTTVAGSAALMGLALAGAAWGFRIRDQHVARKELNLALGQLRGDLRSGEPPDLNEAHEADPNVTFAYFGPDGRLVAKSGILSAASHAGFSLFTIDSKSFMSDGFVLGRATITATIDWTRHREELTELDWTLALLWLGIQLLVAAASWYAAKATFQPLEELTRQAASLSGSDLTRRLSSRDAAEFGSFAKQLNSLLDRIEGTARREEQFASDAAHELRTPLTTLLANMETALLKPRTAPEYREAIEAMVPEAERLARLIDLLLLTTRDAARPIAPHSLKPAIDRCIAQWRDRFEDRSIHLQAQIEDASAAMTDEELSSILDNLLENALRYSPAGSTVQVAAAAQGDMLSIRVRDEGRGVPADLVPRIFDRLTTGEVSRSRTGGGFGIGLALAQNIAQTRKGRIFLSSNDRGAEFTLELPFAHSSAE